MFNLAIYDNPKYGQLINTKNYMRVWSFHENYFLQKAHIKFKTLGGKNIPLNYLLLCKECHQESCDFDDRYFYAYICYMRKNKYKIIEKRNRRFMQAIYEIVYQTNKKYTDNR